MELKNEPYYSGRNSKFNQLTSIRQVGKVPRTVMPARIGSMKGSSSKFALARRIDFLTNLTAENCMIGCMLQKLRKISLRFDEDP